MNRCYEPPTMIAGIEPENPFDLPEMAPGVRGWAFNHESRIYIPLIEGEGKGMVGKFLDSLSPRCCIVNVCNPKLQGMLVRRGWVVTIDEEGCDIWSVPATRAGFYS